MNLSHEFFKVKEGFQRVKSDMHFITDKISENYGEFISKHNDLGIKIESLSKDMKTTLSYARDKMNQEVSLLTDHEVISLKQDIKELKKEVTEIHSHHTKITSSIEDIKSNKKEIKSLKEKLHSSELEIYLMKERLIEKDVEVKQIKDISKHLFNIVDELSKAELDIINLHEKEVRR